jgi:hypothetical protein
MSTEILPDFDSCDFAKLTVPQLKKLCKSRVTGYSKLAKNALVQKLEEYRQGQQSTANYTCTPIIPSVILKDASPRIDIPNKIPVEVLTSPQPSLLEPVLCQQATSGTFPAGPKVPDPMRQPETRRMRIDTLQRESRTAIASHEGHHSSISTSSSPNPAPFAALIRKRSSTPTPDLEGSPKRPKLLETKKINSPVLSSTAVFKIPGLPPAVLTPLVVSLQRNDEACWLNHVYATPTPRLNALNPSLDTLKPAPKRFVPLTRKVLATHPAVPKHEPKTTPHMKEPFCVAEIIPPVSLISIPPKLTQRKLVKSYAVILQGLSNAERRACAASNRLLRYAGQCCIPGSTPGPWLTGCH